MDLANPFPKKELKKKKKNPSCARREEKKSLRVSWWVGAGHKVTPGPLAALMPSKEPEAEEGEVLPAPTLCRFLGLLEQLQASVGLT